MAQKKQKQTTKAKGSKKPRTQPNAKPKGKAKDSSPLARLPTCTANYAQSLVAPWESLGACVPIPPAIPSRKAQYFARGVFKAASTGFGGILQASGLGNDNSTTGNLAPIAYTLGTGTPTTLGAAASSVYFGNNYNCEFSVTNWTDSEIGARVVSMGMRARYIGTTLNMAGTYICLEQPDHATLDGYAFQDLRKFDKGSSQPMDREWHSVTFQPVKPTDYLFVHNNQFPLNNSAIHFLGIAVDGCVDQSPFEYEAFINVEMIGPLARGKSPTITDRVATEKVIEALSYFGSHAIQVMSKGLSSYQAVNKIMSQYMLMTRGQQRIAL